MGTVENTAAHYKVVIADLIAERDALRADADDAERVWKTKQQAVRDIEELIHGMQVRADRKSDVAIGAAAFQMDRPVADFLLDLSTADACMAVLRRSPVPMTNREILVELEKNGYRVNSENPVNNINSCLTHRLGSKGDIEREGKSWKLLEQKGTAPEAPSATLNGSSAHIN